MQPKKPVHSSHSPSHTSPGHPAKTGHNASHPPTHRAPASNGGQQGRSTPPSAHKPHAPTQKDHNGATTKLHPFVIPVCELISIDVWCEHAEKPEHEEHAQAGASNKTSHSASQSHGTSHAATQGKAGTLADKDGKVPQLGGAGRRHARIDKQNHRQLLLEVCAQVETTKGGAITFSNGGKPDSIMFAAKVKSADSKHPLWMLEGPDLPQTLKFPGAQAPFSHGFAPARYKPEDFPGVNIIGISNARWLKGQKPKEYLVTCEACKGQKQNALIRVFAPLASEIEIETEAGENYRHQLEAGHSVTGHKPRKPGKSKFAFAKQAASKAASAINHARESVTKCLEFLVGLIPNVKDVEIKVLEGSLSIGNKWEEEEDSNLVAWKAEIGVHLILIDVGFCIAIFNLNFLPKAFTDTLEEYTGVKLEAFGGIRIEGSIGLDVDAEASIWHDFKFDDKGVGALGLGLEAKAVGAFHETEIVSLTATGMTHVDMEFTPKFSREPQITIERKVVWHPFIIKAEAELRISNKFKPHKSYEHECCEPKTFYPEDIHLLTSHAP